MPDIVTYKIAFEYLKKRGIIHNQQHLADLLNINKGTFSQILSGAISPPKHFVENFANQFGIDKNWLLTGEGEMIQKEDKEKISEVNDPIVEYKAPSETLIESQARLIRIQEQLVLNNTKLVDTNNKLAEQVIELCNNHSLPGAIELIEKLKNEIIFSIKDQLKNSPAREDVGCANAG